jgi:hypothetical protein
MSAQLLIGLTFGRQYCLPCLAYFKLVQPLVGEGRLEDSRPPRLANMIGTAFLGSAASVWWLGLPTAGRALGGLVAALALVAASTGFCAGCELYRLTARLRGISPTHHTRLDPGDLGGLNGNSETAITFVHPLCSECHDWVRRLREAGRPLVSVDVKERPDLARKYGVVIVPTVVTVDAEGTVLARLAP